MIVVATAKGPEISEIIYIIDSNNGNVIHSSILSGSTIERSFKFGQHLVSHLSVQDLTSLFMINQQTNYHLVRLDFQIS